ncbi:MAG: STT3 domain-containing protein [Candidatus Nanohalobium sp.]
MNLSDYREKAEYLSQPENFKQALKENWQIPAVSLTFLIGLWLRYIPAKGMQYLQALDPYMEYRMSKHLALSGSLPALDFTRYFPYATPIHVMNIGNIAVPAFLYRYLGFSLIFPNYLQFAQFYPAFMGAVSVVMIYFLGKEIFDRFTGVSASFFFATLTGVMHRTSAGFFEKEPTGTAFMLISMVFFTRAWKNRNWKNGILSGFAFGLFTISWGGSRAVWLLYPAIVGAVLFIDEDIRSLIAAYTPTVILGGLFASAVNPGKFWFTGKYFLANLGLVALLWSRYLIEEFEILEEHQLKYYVPSISIIGLLMAITAPLYSEKLGHLVLGLWNSATQSGGGVIGGTVAENQAAQISSMVSSLGGNTASGMAAFANWFHSTLPFMQPVVSALGILLVPLGKLVIFLSSFLSPWTFMILGTPLLLTHLLIYLGRKYSIIEEDISGKTYYGYLAAITIAWLISATGFLAATDLARTFLKAGASRTQIFSYAAQLRVNAIILGFVAAGALSGLVYYLKDEAYKVMLMVFGFLTLAEVVGALNVVGSQNMRVIVYALLNSPFARGLVLPTFGGLVAFLFVYLSNDFEKPDLTTHWYYTFPFIWGVTHLFISASTSRLIFLAGFPASFVAGYGFTNAFRKFRAMDLPDIEMDNPESLEDIRKGLMVVAAAVILVTTIFSGYAVAQQLGGSPSRAWSPSLDYMENQTPKGSVILSWWDYGYWFQSIGRRGAVADGGNFGYYSGSDPKINYPLADFLTSSNASNWKWFLQKHSVDYIVLDRSMIGKYSAVSQISRGSNTNFTTMQTFKTGRPINSYLNSKDKILKFKSGGTEIFAPVKVTGARSNTTKLSIDIDGPVTLRAGATTRKINCLLTDHGKVKLGNKTRRNIPYCIAERPAPGFELSARTGSRAGIVLVPKKIADSTLVRLYLMDGYGIDFVKKVQLNRFQYVKMWKVQDLK